MSFRLAGTALYRTVSQNVRPAVLKCFVAKLDHVFPRKATYPSTLDHLQTVGIETGHFLVCRVNGRLLHTRTAKDNKPELRP